MALVNNNQTTPLENISLNLCFEHCYGCQGSKMTFTTVLLTRISMDLSHNQLFGDIHIIIDELASMVNLSSNTFSGTIPLSIGIYMSNLQSLDLSSNLLGRKILQPFAILSQLSILWLFDNNLTRRIPSIARLQTQGKIAFQLGPSHSKVCETNSFINVTKNLLTFSDWLTSFTYISSIHGFCFGECHGYPYCFPLFHVLEARLQLPPYQQSCKASWSMASSLIIVRLLLVRVLARKGN